MYLFVRVYNRFSLYLWHTMTALTVIWYYTRETCRSRRKKSPLCGITLFICKFNCTNYTVSIAYVMSVKSIVPCLQFLGFCLTITPANFLHHGTVTEIFCAWIYGMVLDTQIIWSMMCHLLVNISFLLISWFWSSDK